LSPPRRNPATIAWWTGNTLHAQAAEIVQSLASALADRPVPAACVPRPWADADADHPTVFRDAVAAVAALDANVVFRAAEPSLLTTGVLIHYALNQNDAPAREALVRLMAFVAHERAFNFLRTERQLGYVVQVVYDALTVDVPALSLIVQSSFKCVRARVPPLRTVCLVALTVPERFGVCWRRARDASASYVVDAVTEFWATFAGDLDALPDDQVAELQQQYAAITWPTPTSLADYRHDERAVRSWRRPPAQLLTRLHSGVIIVPAVAAVADSGCRLRAGSGGSPAWPTKKRRSSSCIPPSCARHWCETGRPLRTAVRWSEYSRGARSKGRDATPSARQRNLLDDMLERWVRVELAAAVAAEPPEDGAVVVDDWRAAKASWPLYE